MAVQRMNKRVHHLNFLFELRTRGRQLLLGALLCDPLGGEATAEVPELGVIGADSSAMGILRVDQRALVGPSPVSSLRSRGCIPHERSLA
jgi:hypothetical protein